MKEILVFTLNCYDANYRDKIANFIVKGGTFKNFNPKDNAAECKDINYVLDSYTVTESSYEGDKYYTVKAKSGES